MGKKFIFRSPEYNFECILEKQQCNGFNKKGDRCKRKCITPFEYCYQHLANIKKLKVKKSTIPNAGKGLFAYDPNSENNETIFKKDDKIIEYIGENINQEQKTNRYGNQTCPYCAGLSKDNIVDAGCVRGVGSHINTGRNSNLNNAKLVIDTRNKQINVKATKNIRNNQEIFIPYGSSYRLNENNVSYNTKYFKVR
jgi:hypothetical protein